MTRWKPLALGGLLLGIATATFVPFALRSARSVRTVAESPRSASRRFDRRQSAALFVGVRHFTSDSIEEVPFAVDDAIDLAYVFALERRVSLVPPRRVVLALSGRPVKKESRDRLRALQDAGADVRLRAGAGDIRAALREQAALAGRDGMLIVSMASHGFLHDGSGYILGTSSVIRNPATMLSTADMLEVIASSAAQRSLVFVDACRERMVSGTRAVLANTMSAAPLVRRLGHTRGQVVFYAAAAGQWSYDDAEAHNGVFTKAVIDGINCGAAKVRGVVTAETLASYVERNVHTWIRDNRDPNIGSATQVTIDGEARNMPLAQCWPPFLPNGGPARVVASGTMVHAFSDKNEPLWQRDAGGVVTHAEAVDLDADGRREVVFATRDAVTAFDASGNPLWSAREAMKVTAFITGDLFRQHTNEVVALRNDEHSPASRLVVYGPDGARLGAFDSDGHLDRVTIGRPTNRHAPRIIATSGNILLVFDPKKLASGKPLWAGRVSPRAAGAIASLEIVDCDGGGKSDIALTTASGAKVCVDFTGHAIRSHSAAHFERLAPKRSRLRG
ncbi:MAG TPA: caspase family protein [Thermoanaerobaculia bacterium]|nr:caspase family protein [Thermoanaerobaculia bacterium]